MALCEIDRARAGGKPLSPPTARLLAEKFAQYNDQYLAFSEFHTLNDASITTFINTLEAQGKAQADPLVPLTEELREFEMPKPRASPFI